MLATHTTDVVSASAAIAAVVVAAVALVGKMLDTRLKRIEEGQSTLTDDVFEAIGRLRDDQAATRENVAYIAGINHIDLPRKLHS